MIFCCSGTVVFIPSTTNSSSARLRRKLIVYGVTRDDCIMRLKRALEEFVVEGMKTTVPLQQKIIRTEAFQRGDYTIKWLEQWLEEQAGVS